MLGKLNTHLRALLGGLLVIAGAPAAIGAEISRGVVRIGVVNDQTGFLIGHRMMGRRDGDIFAPSD